ncbi:MAG: F0F1 ATP synthase subunit delta [Candidatus Dadabacteria bacterium]|nr:F0F1 ATP synthase subunit delta [Candidatus Dadabacteria bacterium]
MASVAKLKDLTAALMAHCEADGSAPECARGLEMFFEDVEASPDLRKAVRSPVVTPGEKTAVVRDLCAARGVPAAAVNFLAAAAEFGRLGELLKRRETVLEKLRSAGGVARATVTLARAASPEEESRIRGVVGRLAGAGGAQVEFVEDSEIIGGIVVRVGNSVYDDSVKLHLERVRAALSK